MELLSDLRALKHVAVCSQTVGEQQHKSMIDMDKMLEAYVVSIEVLYRSCGSRELKERLSEILLECKDVRAAFAYARSEHVDWHARNDPPITHVVERKVENWMMCGLRYGSTAARLDAKKSHRTGEMMVCGKVSPSFSLHPAKVSEPLASPSVASSTTARKVGFCPSSRSRFPRHRPGRSTSTRLKDST